MTRDVHLHLLPTVVLDQHNHSWAIPEEIREQHCFSAGGLEAESDFNNHQWSTKEQ